VVRAFVRGWRRPDVIRRLVLIANYHGPRVRIDPEPMLLGLPILWIAIAVFLFGPICVGVALYRLLTD
jgi:hypothetical protein